jgi:hypothetical protein
VENFFWVGSGLFLFPLKVGDYVNKNKSAIELVGECIAQGDLTDQRLEWEYTQEFRRKNHFTYIDRKQRKVVNLADGGRIPGTNYRVSGAINAPISPHIVTISNAIESKIQSNWPFLVPQVRAATAEDDDRDAAKNSTMLLMYYRDALDEESLFKEALGYIMPCGNVFIKTFWDVNAGDYGAMDEWGNAIQMGDVVAKINSPQKMLIPKGIPNDQELPWIGEQNALPIERIKDTWGEDVSEEGNLEELNALKSLDVSSNQLGKNQLKGHARVTEIYFKPTKDYPLGRLIISCKKKVLYDDVWDKKLTSKYPDEWNPYSKIGWVNIQGDYWCKSILFYLIDHQIQLNRLYKKMVQSKKYPRGWWDYRKGTVNWSDVNTESDDGTMRIEWTSERPNFNNAPMQNLDIINEMQTIKQWMNDIASNYEVSRGNAPSNITSGKQVAQLQAANNIQSVPLLSSFSHGFINHWKKELRLCAVHYESQGRLIRVTGENNETISETFKPDQIKSEDIILATGQSFLLAPEDRNAELDRAFQMGLMGDVQDQAVKKRYLELRGLGGGLEELYADYTSDVTMAKWENDEFEKGNFKEQDQLMIQDTLFNRLPFTPELTKWKEAHDTWQMLTDQYERNLQNINQGIEPIDKLQGNPPPVEPGDEPQPPIIYRLARPYEDHTVHIEILNRLRKTHKYEMLCLQNPEFRKALDFHYQSHLSYIVPPVSTVPAIAQQGNVTNNSQPSSGNTGQNPVSLGTSQLG